jgi:hypothetical protein
LLFLLICSLKNIILGKLVHEYANGGTLAKFGLEQKLLSLDDLPVLVNDNDVPLPNGDTVLNGAALLVHSVVRSESTNAGTVDQLLNEQGDYHFKHLIDGGRFVTTDARAALEDAGVMLFIKDASAKKRGANTSFSSMEISAASSLANEEVDVHDMQVLVMYLSKNVPQLDNCKLR